MAMGGTIAWVVNFRVLLADQQRSRALIFAVSSTEVGPFASNYGARGSGEVSVFTGAKNNPYAEVRNPKNHSFASFFGKSC
jgi:hypothetical protein